MSLGDIYYILFRRKWIIIACAMLGIGGAMTLFAIKPPRYRSEAKLYIRYVVESKSLNLPGNNSDAKQLNEQESSILNAELEFLQSRDVAQLVVSNMGAAKILAKLGGGANFDRAVDVVSGYMEPNLMSRSSVISITYEHPDPEIAQEVLNQIIAAYIRKHKDMHQPPAGMFGDFLTRETQRLRSELAETEEQLRQEKNKSGVGSIEDAKNDYARQAAKIREQVYTAQAELARHESALEDLPKVTHSGSEVTNTGPEIPAEQINEYKTACARLDYFSKRGQELELQFTTNSPFVKENRDYISENLKLKKKLEDQYPKLTTLFIPSPGPAGQPMTAAPDPAAEAAQIRSIKSTINVLNSQLANIRAEVARLDEIEPAIQELQRKKEMLEAEIKSYSGNLEESRIEAALGAGKAPNIGVLQGPSDPVKGWSKPFMKKVKMLAAGGVGGGFALAFLIELILDRSVKRPSDVERKLKLPLFISIPDLSRTKRHKAPALEGKDLLLLKDAGPDSNSKEPTKELPALQLPMLPVAVWDRSHPLRRYYAGLRDRLITYFEVRNLTQKPKLVAVTSCGRGGGVSSIAAGLAASLSETGDGNVLLVDMNAEQGASQQFYKGKPGCGLDDALARETKESAFVQSNLYVATERTEPGGVPQLLPQRFANLMPKLKASDYDYIIFDMPAISQTSSTPRLARLMDMVLLVIESEKTNQDAVKQATAMLVEAKAEVSAVLNKTRTYVPGWLHHEFLNEP